MSCPLLMAQSPEGLFFRPATQVASVAGSFANGKPQDAIISIGNSTPSVKVVDSDSFPVGSKVTRIAALLGSIKLKLNTYVIVANTVEVVGKLLGHTIYKVAQRAIVPVTPDYEITDLEESDYIKLLEMQVKNATFYFSYTYDLTNSMQRNEKLQNFNQFNWRNCDTRFFWNHYITKDLRDLARAGEDPLLDKFIQPVIYGYANFKEAALHATPITLGLITRRSRFRAGTRYFRRGIDADGHVGNFNETEQFLITWGATETDSKENQVFSFLQTRGSVPVYWAEINNLKYKPELVLGGNSIDATERHFDQQIQLYGDNYLVNLVNQSGHELPVKQAYEAIVEQLGNPKLHYKYFDFHHECRHMQWHRVKLLIQQLNEMGLQNTDFFHKTFSPSDGQTIQVLSEQQSTVRTNCMDCLDRTNVVQSVLAHWVLQKEFESAAVIEPGSNQVWESDSNLLSIFQNMWADNADAVSISYAGTGALKTDFTRTGKRTMAGAFADFINSASRYYKNNLTDGPRQDSFDLFLGNYRPSLKKSLASPFEDKRPFMVQTFPSFLYAALTVFFATIFFPKDHFTSSKNLLFFLGSVVALLVSGYSMLNDGLQFVNWPKLVDTGFVSIQHNHGKGKDPSTIRYVRNPAFSKPVNVKKTD